MQLSMMMILLQQLVSMFQLQCSQPDILTTIITYKQCQALQLTIVLIISLYTQDFILSFSVNLNWRHISMNTIVLPIAQQQHMKHIMHTMQCCMRR